MSRRWRQARRRVRRHAKPIRRVLALVLLVVVASGAWVTYRAFGVRDDLLAARTQLTRVESAARAGDVPAARGALTAAQRRTDEAADATRDPVWRAAEHVPFAGASLTNVSGIARAGDDLASHVLPALIDASEVFSGEATSGTTIDLAPFRASVRPLGKASSRVSRTRADLNSLPRARIAAVRDARSELMSRVDQLSSLVEGALTASRVAPGLLGGDGPRRYFLGIQNNAEARATGGLLGSFGIVDATSGRLDLTRTGANSELRNPTAPVTQLGPEFDARYSRFFLTSDWRSTNLTPDFPTVGRLWAAMWEATAGQRIDGAIAVDPVALSFLLEATGPVTMSDGTRLSAENIVEFTLSTAYQRFGDENNPQREAYLNEVTQAVFDRVKRGGVDSGRLAERLGHAVRTGHLRVYSTRPDEQRELEKTQIAGQLPARQKQPYLQVITQNSGGNKLDYYLRRTVEYDGHLTGEAVDTGSGPVPEERARVTVTLTNNAPPSGLPRYVTARPDLPRGAVYPPGQNKVFLSVYAGVGSTLEGATLDGSRTVLESETEKGHAVFSTEVVLDPGESTTLVLDLFQPTTPGAELVYQQQPLVVPDDVVIRQRQRP